MKKKDKGIIVFVLLLALGGLFGLYLDKKTTSVEGVIENIASYEDGIQITLVGGIILPRLTVSDNPAPLQKGKRYKIDYRTRGKILVAALKK